MILAQAACRTWALDGIRAQIEAGFSEFSQGILVVCSRKLRKIRTGWGDEARQVDKSDRLLMEGEGEEQAVPLLLRRLLWEMQVFDVEIGAPIRRTRDRLAGRDGLAAVLEVVRRTEDVEGILVLLDADDACAAREGPRIANLLQELAPDLCIGVVLANREYEAWLLASWETLMDANSQAPMTGDPDVPRDAKGRIARGLGIRYHEPIDQVRLSQRIDLRLAAGRSRSFRKLVKEVERLLRLCGKQPASLVYEAPHGQG